MKKDHDWQELAAAMSNYSTAVPSLQNDWANLCLYFSKRTDLPTDAAAFAAFAAAFPELIDRFIQDNEDASIALSSMMMKEAWNQAQK
jgi:hypothetical protein